MLWPLARAAVAAVVLGAGACRATEGGAPIAAVASAPIPFRPEHGSDAVGLGPGWLAVVVVLCAVAAALLYAMRRGTPLLQPRQGRAIRLVETCRLPDGTQLSVVHYAGRALLLAHGESGTQVLVQDALVPEAAEGGRS